MIGLGHEDPFPPPGQSGRCWSRKRSEIYITDGAACMGSSSIASGSGAGELPLLNAFKGAILASKPAGAS
jgi:hypothetical protein